MQSEHLNLFLKTPSDLSLIKVLRKYVCNDFLRSKKKHPDSDPTTYPDPAIFVSDQVGN
jgi:hypothetical protein